MTFSPLNSISRSLIRGKFNWISSRCFSKVMSSPKVAILYQALPPPVIGGLRKKPRADGYSDSGADIGYALRQGGIEVLTPQEPPSPTVSLDWVFPDTEEGIKSAIESGANTLWTNTIVFDGHPVEKFMNKVRIVGQLPSSVNKYDDKFLTNHLLIKNGLPTANSFSIGRQGSSSDVFLDANDQIDIAKVLSDYEMSAPLIIKPIRGRGSQGVVLADTDKEVLTAVLELLDSKQYGDSVMVEENLSGEEITISVMPPNSLLPNGKVSSSYWSLMPIVRTGHKHGVVPFNGDVPVAQNSRPMTPEERQSPEAQTIERVCERAAEVTGARGLVRIDCRKDARGVYQIFDFNMKPALSGGHRPGRDFDTSLSAMAALADGMDYTDLLKSMLASRWSL